MTQCTVQYAPAYARAIALLIDSIIISFPETILLMVAGTSSMVAIFGQYLLYAAYFSYFESSSWQATPGKRLLKIHVMHANGSRLVRRDALARFIAFSMFVFPAQVSFLSKDAAAMLTLWLMLVWFIPMVSTPVKTAMHDILCRTRVVVGVKAGKLLF
jgi:uncharacterized RDD family membrane protein YckC